MQHHENFTSNGAVEKKTYECKQCEDIMPCSAKMRVLVIKTYFETKSYGTVRNCFRHVFGDKSPIPN